MCFFQKVPINLAIWFNLLISSDSAPSNGTPRWCRGTCVDKIGFRFGTSEKHGNLRKTEKMNVCNTQQPNEKQIKSLSLSETNPSKVEFLFRAPLIKGLCLRSEFSLIERICIISKSFEQNFNCCLEKFQTETLFRGPNSPVQSRDL